MPNHITNVIKISEPAENQLSMIASAILNEQGHIDFNRLIPKPEGFKDFEVNQAVIDLAKCIAQAPISGNLLMARIEIISREKTLACREKIEAEHGEELKLLIANYEATGFFYWYDWNAHNWGTKWNAYGQPAEGFGCCTSEYSFETAWAHPTPVIRALSRKFPNITFQIEYADEDLGSNAGIYSIIHGDIVEEDIAPDYNNQSPEEKLKWRKFAFHLIHGVDALPKDHDMNEKYEYVDEE